MSVLVYADGVLASDSFANNGSTAYPVTKLWKSDDGQTLYGAIGKPLQAMTEIYNWAIAGCNPNEFPPNAIGATLVAVTKDKGLVRYSSGPTPILHGNNHVAFGEGSEIAYGVLHAFDTFLDGLDEPEELGQFSIAPIAVQGAIKHNIHCNGDVVSITFD